MLKYSHILLDLLEAVDLVDLVDLLQDHLDMEVGLLVRLPISMRARRKSRRQLL